MARQRHVVLREPERLTGGHAHLPLDEVEACDEFGDGVLDLQARVHLHEEELVGRVGADDELDRPRTDVVDGSCCVAGRFADSCTRGVVEQR